MSLKSDLLIYATAFAGPFIQEDSAIIGAVTAFLHPEVAKMASPTLILLAMFTGLVISDLWKYWIGFAGRSQGWAKAMAEKPAILALGEKIKTHPGKTLLIARYIIGTRIPAYIASGFFGVPFAQFSFWIVVSAMAYVGVAILVLKTVGMAAGKTGQVYVAIGFVVLIAGYLTWKWVANRRAST